MLFGNFLGFTTAYFHHGKLVTDRMMIFSSYLLSFALDVIVYLSLMASMIYEDKFMVESKTIELLVFLQYGKFIKIFRTLVDRFKIDMKFGYYLDFLKLILTSLFVMHCIACIWYAIGAFYNEEKCWLKLQDISQKSDAEKYIYSLYWSAVTMMTVGYGDIGPQNSLEVLFVIFVVVIGCGLFAYYINSVGALMQEINKESYLYKYFFSKNLNKEF